ncbi:hypothetical protein NDU88_008811 [Pleurodeles waltl]|uniref:Uncharacterized protein n=1 Tax=Pleurodeles waltl TaxID=8319 RepID=A0AAV7N8E8_PLEWA|nr:hypothetical protein NDU88_008811 [Pleurodeles waltl]
MHCGRCTAEMGLHPAMHCGGAAPELQVARLKVLGTRREARLPAFASSLDGTHSSVALQPPEPDVKRALDPGK